MQFLLQFILMFAWQFPSRFIVQVEVYDDTVFL